jgi:hypothetical protein
MRSENHDPKSMMLRLEASTWDQLTAMVQQLSAAGVLPAHRVETAHRDDSTPALTIRLRRGRAHLN